MSAKKKWIGFGQGYKGTVTVNSGAATALAHKKASLLAVGITAIDGQFPSESVVKVNDETGFEIGRGICNFSSEQLQNLMGKHSSEVKQAHPDRPDEVIHRDRIVIYKEFQNE